jgi:hypothetical protein
MLEDRPHAGVVVEVGMGEDDVVEPQEPQPIGETEEALPGSFARQLAVNKGPFASRHGQQKRITVAAFQGVQREHDGSQLHASSNPGRCILTQFGDLRFREVVAQGFRLARLAPKGHTGFDLIPPFRKSALLELVCGVREFEALVPRVVAYHHLPALDANDHALMSLQEAKVRL